MPWKQYKKIEAEVSYDRFKQRNQIKGRNYCKDTFRWKFSGNKEE